MMSCVCLYAAGDADKEKAPVAVRGEEQSNLPKYRLTEERAAARGASGASNVDRIASEAGRSKSFAVVDLAEVYSEFYPAKAAQENFRLLAQQAESELEKMMNEGKPLFEERDTLMKKLDAPALSEDARKKLEGQLTEIATKIRQKGEAIGQFQQEKEMKLNEHRQTVLAEHFKEINLDMERMAKERNLDCILNKASVLYVKPDMDLTATAVREVNKPYQKEIKEAEKKAAEAKAKEAEAGKK